ncbi:MAG: phosphate acyltransferase [Lachnospiraceae bacterium]
MNIIEKLMMQAKKQKVKIAFPEIQEEKIMLAAAECVKQGLCIPVLFGAGDEINVYAEKYGVSLDGMQLIDTSDEELKEKVFERYALYNPKLSLKAMKRKSKDPMYLALMMEAAGEVDVTFAGMSHTTGEVIFAGQMIIGLQDGITTVSSVAVSEIPGYEGCEGNLLAFGDSAVCANPSVEDLASIAVSGCETVQALLGWEPRCAMLSFSTTGSAENILVDKVREACELAQKMAPEYKIDGEFQLDAAVVPEIAAKKVKRESDVAGRANLLIWPDLNTGNIAVKIFQQFAHADAYGPVLQGFKKIVCDCSRSAPVSELMGNIAIAAVRAQKLNS